MPDKSQIPHLLSLLDDDSEDVRKTITRELCSFGPKLAEALEQMRDELNERQLALMEEVIAIQRGDAARREAWRQWPGQSTLYAQLETAMDLLAQFQYGWEPPVHLGELLDNLADEYRDSGRPVNPVELSRFLFETKELRGNSEEYYDPLNNNILHTIEHGVGLPITLALVFMLVGNRVGLRIHGCNTPAHFMCRAEIDNMDKWFDCFNGGRRVPDDELAPLREALGPERESLLTDTPSAVEIIARVLRNLVNGYDLDEDHEKRELFEALQTELLETAE